MQAIYLGIISVALPSQTHPVFCRSSGSSTQGMSPAVIEKGLPVILAENALAVWQNPDFVKGCSASLRVRIKITQPVVGSIMQPVTLL
jgi:hypothetical protein